MIAQITYWAHIQYCKSSSNNLGPIPFLMSCFSLFLHAPSAAIMHILHLYTDTYCVVCAYQNISYASIYLLSLPFRHVLRCFVLQPISFLLLI